MNPNDGAAARHQDRRAPIRPMKEPPAERRWRRSLAALAISALAIGGVSTVAAAPAFADDAGSGAVVAADGAEVAPAETPAAEDPVSEPASEPAPEPAPAPASAEPAPAEEPAAVAVEEPAPAEEPAAPEPADPAAAPPVVEGTEGEAPPVGGEAEASAATSEAVALLVPPPLDEVVDKVEICHATSSYKNPYIVNEPAADGDVSGHAGHTGQIFSPDIPKHTEWGDIIPPFWYDGGGELPSYFPGLNWTAEGQAIYENDCVIPTPVPVMTITPTDCPVYGGSGSVLVELGPVQANVEYSVTIYDSEGVVVDEWLIEDATGTVQDEFALPPGDYTITLEQSIIANEWEFLDEQFFTIGECPELDLMVTPGDCSTGDDGTVTVLFTGLIAGESYTWFVEGDGYSDFDSFIAEGDSSELVIVDLPPGNFVAYIEWDGETPVFDWAGFAIEPCQPGITVEVTECPAAGGTGSAWLTLSNLVAGVEYEVKVTDRGDAGGAPYGGVHVVMGDSDGNAQLLVSSLPADHEYTAWIHGVFEATWEEPPFVGGGGFTPIGTVELSASVDFALQPCPAVPVTPTKVVPAKALPATGVNGAGELLLGSMLLLGLGGASLIAARRRRTGDQHLS